MRSLYQEPHSNRTSRELFRKEGCKGEKTLACG